MQAPAAADLWAFLPLGYALTVAIELPILLAGLSSQHPLGRRVFAGFWLTAVTYPVVVLVLPPLIWSRFGEGIYLAVAETFAPVAECLLFWLAFGQKETAGRDSLAIILANLASFLVGGWLVEMAGRWI
jgi:hypothetical protein